MKVKDLLPGWIEENLKKARKEYWEANKAYDSFNITHTTFPQAIKKIRDIKKEIVIIWKRELNQCNYDDGVRAKNADEVSVHPRTGNGQIPAQPPSLCAHKPADGSRCLKCGDTICDKRVF